MYHRLGSHFGRTRWNSLVTWVKWNHVSVRLEIVFVWVQDRCMVCAKRTIGSETILDAPMVLLGDQAHVHARFGLFGDSANLHVDWCTVCTERTIGFEIVLDVPDGTPT